MAEAFSLSSAPPVTFHTPSKWTSEPRTTSIGEFGVERQRDSRDRRCSSEDCRQRDITIARVVGMHSGPSLP
jgi:hypothetical protein